MTIVAIAAVCVVLLVLAFVAPRASRHPERGVLSVFGLGSRARLRRPRPARPSALQAFPLGLEVVVEERLGRPQGPLQDARLSCRPLSGGGATKRGGLMPRTCAPSSCGRDDDADVGAATRAAELKR